MPIDDLFFINDSTLIVTTQDWEVIKHCSIELSKVNIKELDEEISLRLFITYSYRHKDKLSNELIEVGKNIVKACDSLPLSLKIIGIYLRDKKILRCWKQAF